MAGELSAKNSQGRGVLSLFNDRKIGTKLMIGFACVLSGSSWALALWLGARNPPPGMKRS